MATFKPSQLQSLTAATLPNKGGEFFPIFWTGKNYTLTLAELKKYIGTSSSGGGSSVDLTSVDSNIIPDSNNQHVLGNTEYAWKSLYLGDSINFTGTKGTISGAVNIDGSLKINNLDVAMKSEVQAVSSQLSNYLKNSSVKVSNVYTSYPDIVTAIPERYYAVHKDANGNLMVQVPWEKGASGDFLTKSQADGYYLPLKTIDTVVTYGSSNLITSGAVENRVRTLEEDISTRGYLTSSLADSTYLKKNSDIELGTHIIKGNGGYDILNSVGEWVIVGNGTSAAGMDTYIDGDEIYLRYGTGHTTRVKISSAGTDIYGGLGVSEGIYSGSNIFSYASGWGLYMAEDSINLHYKGEFKKQLFKFDPSSGKVNLVNGFETNVTSYIGSASNEDYKALLFRRSGNGFRINATSNYGYLCCGPLNDNKDEIKTLNAIIRFSNTGIEFSPNDVNYYDILTSNHNVGQYVFQDKSDNRLAASTNLDNVSYGVWGTLDNTIYTNAPIQNFGLIVSRLNQVYKGQLLLPYGNQDIYYRAQYYNNGKIEWYDWRKILTDAGGTIEGALKIKGNLTVDGTNCVLKFANGTTEYWELNNQGGGAGNRPAFSKNLQIKDGTTYRENVHSGNISNYAITQHQDISGKQDKITDLSTIRSNASNGNTAYNWGDHSAQGYALKYNFMSFDGVLAADDKGILPYLRTSSPSYGYTSSIANMSIRYCKSSNFNSGYGAFFAYDSTALQTAAMQGNYGSVPIYYAFPNSEYYNDFNNSRTYAVAKSYKLFGNNAELYGNHTAGLHKLIHEGNISNYTLTQSTADSTYLKKSGATTLNDTLRLSKDLGGSVSSFVNYQHNTPFEVGRNSNAMCVAIGVTDDDYGIIQSKGKNITSSGKLAINPLGGDVSIGGLQGSYTPSMVVLSNGNVGIGTASPAYKLDANGDTKINGYLYIGGKSNTSYLPLIMRRNYHGLRVNVADGGVYFSYGELNSNQTDINQEKILMLGDWGLKYSPDAMTYYEILTSKGGTIEGALTITGHLKAGSFELSTIRGNTTIDGNLTCTGSLSVASFAPSSLTIPNSTNKYGFVLEDDGGYGIFRPDGTFRAYLGTNTVPFYAVYSSAFTQASDATKKNILGNTELTLSQIANAPAVDFTWKDSGEKSVGTIAQYWKSVLPEVVSGDEGSMGMNYATLGVVASIVIARSVETNAQRIARLEQEIESLQKELASLNKSA